MDELSDKDKEDTEYSEERKTLIKTIKECHSLYIDKYNVNR